MFLIRLMLIPLMMLSLSTQGMAAVSMMGCAKSSSVASAHEHHATDESAASSHCDTADVPHQHGGSLCVDCFACSGGAALNTRVGSITPIARLLPVADRRAALFSVFIDWLDKPPKSFLV
jgi:hypothetical protein